MLSSRGKRRCGQKPHLFVLTGIVACRCSGISGWDGEVPPPAEEELVAIWDALCESRLPPPLDIEAVEDGAPVGGLSPLAAAARYEKYVKGKLSVAADHFNRDYKKGFQYLQVRAHSTHERHGRGWTWSRPVQGEQIEALGFPHL